jgi:Zn finger protein HypA/HybF involved in hydrogenase expression
MDETALDGNVLAGPLREIFAMDVTSAVTRCANCGRTGPVAWLRVYADAPGLVARCPGCEAVMLRLVHGRDTVWLDLRGMVTLALPAAEP